MHQVRDDLGIGLRLEHVAQRTQLLALFFVVLDDAVVDQGHAVADVRVGVGLGHPAVGGPAGVADPEQRIEPFTGGGLLHLGHAAGTPHPAHVRLGLALVEHGDAGGIVTAIFQSLQSFDEDRYHIAIRDCSHNAAHRF
ncbi:hypothetical protein D3C87_199720 [compost metagenome]